MTHASQDGFSGKHGAGAEADPRIRAAVSEKAKEGRLSCAAAFAVAKQLGVAPSSVGRTVDLMDYRLTHCQLGLFGYQPEKKIVKPLETVDDDLAAAIRSAMAESRLSCKAAWEIADTLGLGKKTVSGACERLGVKIKPCQLGAF
jgi:hypothetical protein